MKMTLTALAALAFACATSRSKEASTPSAPGPAAPTAAIALEGLGSHRRNVSHASPEAQRWFDQGLNVVYAFNHDEASQAFWQVGDVEKEVAELKAKGVKFEEYDMPGLKTVNGIATAGGAKSAWFKDVDGNILALVQNI